MDLPVQLVEGREQRHVAQLLNSLDGSTDGLAAKDPRKTTWELTLLWESGEKQYPPVH